MKAFLTIFISLAVCANAWAGNPLKNIKKGVGTVKRVPKTGTVKIPKGTVPKVKVPSGTVQVPRFSVPLPNPALRLSVSQQVEEAAIARVLLKSPALMRASALPEVKPYRTDLINIQLQLAHLNTYSTADEVLKNQNHPAVLAAYKALEDMAAIGIYGSVDDIQLLLASYQAFSGSALEPIALTTIARSLVALGMYPMLEKVLDTAKPTAALESVSEFLTHYHFPVKVPHHTAYAPVERINELSVALGPLSRLNGKFTVEAMNKWVLSAYEHRIPKKAKTKTVTKPTTTPQQAATQAPAEQQPAEQAQQEDALSYAPVIPVLDEKPRPGLVSKVYPSGLRDEDSLIRDWMISFKNGYFKPRNQVEAIMGMSPAKANNLMEFLYYMPLDEAERVIFNPIRETGRLPDFMYDARLIEGTRRLPAGYYKNKFNENVKRFVELADGENTLYEFDMELKDLVSSMADYSFKQGFAYKNSPALTNGLRAKWHKIEVAINRPGLKADREQINRLWNEPVELEDGTKVSLRDYFTQTRSTAFFKEGKTPEFYLNSARWVSWENERRNLAASEYVGRPEKLSWWDKVQNWLVLGKPSQYLTLNQFGDVMRTEFEKGFGGASADSPYLDCLAGTEDEGPSSLTMTINNFDKVGGVCQASFGDGGYMGRVEKGYNGTSTVSRFQPQNFTNVKVVTFDFKTLQPRVQTLASVPYLKDLKKPDLDQVRAGTMVGDGLDPTRDLLGVQQADQALVNIPHLKATIYPFARLAAYEGTVPPYLTGGGLGGYLALFTPDFYPLKTIYRLRFNGWKPYLEKTYYIRKEVPALSGAIHRDRLTFSEQIMDRVVKTPEKPEK